MKILIQNLQKRDGLASQLMEEYEPDIFLAQEIHVTSEDNPKYEFNTACYVSNRYGYGTAISGSSPKHQHVLDNIRPVESPHTEVGGWIRKKTIIADIHFNEFNNNIQNTVECISFHGYNGTPFYRYTEYLVDHVRAVLQIVREKGPAIFAGDFNTWTSEHVKAVEDELQQWGFHRVYSWNYPDSDKQLDHVFLRELTLQKAKTITSPSDHLGALIEVVF